MSFQAGTGAPDICDVEVVQFPNVVAYESNALHPLNDVIKPYEATMVKSRLETYQGAELCASELTGVSWTGTEGWEVPEISESVSEKDGIITITVGNLSATEDKDLTIGFAEAEGREVVEARIVANADYHAYNTFDEPEIVREEDFTGYKWNGGRLETTLPKASVVEIRVR